MTVRAALIRRLSISAARMAGHVGADKAGARIPQAADSKRDVRGPGGRGGGFFPKQLNCRSCHYPRLVRCCWL